MKPDELAPFRRRLLELRAALLHTASTREEGGATVELDQARTGRLSRMDALQLQAMAQATEGRARARLRAIDAALARCDSGDYGHCVECDGLIDPRRLASDPATPLCIDCAEAREQNR